LLQLANIIARTQSPNNKPMCRANVGPCLMREGFSQIGFSIFAFARRSLVSFGVIAALLLPAASRAGVLSESDLQRVEALKPLFANLMSDLSQTAKRSDVAAADANCINSTIQELLQISDELASYEYLIGMDREIKDFGDKSPGDKNPMHDLVKFAADKSSAILTSERKRLVQLSDQCAHSPVASSKTQETLQVIDTTTTVLTAIRDRL
ncbi:MAG TPA: hypothetical protein VK734_04060, partial [Bradyrhizobium sp.]|nr:hypothetical protein [Bradyrhizobium sp.]